MEIRESFMEIRVIEKEIIHLKLKNLHLNRNNFYF